MQAATAITHKAAIIECAALRERPNPALIKARPAPASGASRRKKIQEAVWISDSVTPHPLWESDESAPPARVPTPRRPHRPAGTRRADRRPRATLLRPAPIPSLTAAIRNQQLSFDSAAPKRRTARSKYHKNIGLHAYLTTSF